MVFTLPDGVAALALQNRRLCYGLLFRTASRALRTIAADPKHLGAEIGFLAVLHTWSQTLLHHPHVHCVVPAGGIAPDGIRWVSCRAGFFLPVRVLSRLFRRLYLAGLRRAFDEGELVFRGGLASLRQPSAFALWMRASREREWVVYAKPPFGGPTQVLKYLARYTHRVAISNARLVDVDDDHVRFLWKDRAHGGKSRCMRVSGVEFVRRFLLHVLPEGFVRIRHFGFLSNRGREKKLPLARRLIREGIGEGRGLARDESCSNVVVEPWRQTDERCPSCTLGRMQPAGAVEPLRVSVADTS